MSGLTADIANVAGLAGTEGEDLSRVVSSTGESSTGEEKRAGPRFLHVLESVLEPRGTEVPAGPEATADPSEEPARVESETVPVEVGERSRTPAEPEEEQGTHVPLKSTAPGVNESITHITERLTTIVERLADIGTSQPESEELVSEPVLESLPTPVDDRPPVIFEFESPRVETLPLEHTSVSTPPAQPGNVELPLVGTGRNELELRTIAELAGTQSEASLIGSEPASEPSRTSAGTMRIEPDLSLVEPDLRVRLERIVERMRMEFGHNVKVIEAYRTPQRQQALFAQGRTTPGPVVTWTETSMHTEGLAVDVMVDGSFAPHEGYRRLATIAEEEGLRSLWPKDPGHLELRLSEQGPAPRPVETAPRLDRIALAATGERPTQVARVAAVELSATPAELEVPATPAEVARPAQVAVPGSGESSRQPELVIPTASQVGERVALNDRPTERSRRGRESLGADLAAATETAANAPSTRTAAEPIATPILAGESGLPTVGSLLVGSPRSMAPESLHRISQIREIQELAYPRRLGQVTLRMMDGLGEEARMRVRLEGGGVSTAIGVRDLGHADLLRTRIGALEQSLRLQGIESTSVRVGALTAALESLETTGSSWGEAGRRSEGEADADRQGRREENARGSSEHRSGSRQDEAFEGRRENNR